jgi:hypothetical protein
MLWQLLGLFTLAIVVSIGGAGTGTVFGGLFFPILLIGGLVIIARTYFGLSASSAATFLGKLWSTLFSTTVSTFQGMSAALAYVAVVVTLAAVLGAPLFPKTVTIWYGFYVPDFTSPFFSEGIVIPLFGLLGLVLATWAGWLPGKSGQKIVTWLYIILVAVGVLDLIAAKYSPALWNTYRSAAQGRLLERTLVKSQQSAIAPLQKRVEQLQALARTRPLTPAERSELLSLGAQIRDNKELLQADLARLDEAQRRRSWQFCIRTYCWKTVGHVGSNRIEVRFEPVIDGKSGGEQYINWRRGETCPENKWGYTRENITACVVLQSATTNQYVMVFHHTTKEGHTSVGTLKFR